ncbi:chaplin [Streptomyces sp. A3M-1-3]|uniref:chaplin n=1 Tax=Streptomyces sp. A3M-1-3 TaxID=2962044 RepID=UPI0020B860D4|nr:chaplin [Streptomyces sp. A3M-1-3]MCP3820365.1 chaplin [Streptomyces sp. A3M-1-3]
MRQVLSKGMLTAAAASSLLSLGAGNAHADSGTASDTAHSPGVLAGNSVSAPVDTPVNACGNTVDVVGALNPAFGNKCASDSVDPPEIPEIPETPEPRPQTPRPAPPRHVPPQVTPPAPPAPRPDVPELAATGTPEQLAATAAVGGGLLLGGALLYRRRPQ